MSDFDISEYIKNKGTENAKKDEGCEFSDFINLCEKIKATFFSDWERGESSRTNLEIQKRAIIGYEKEKSFYIDRIKQLINEYSCQDVAYPSWYNSLEEGVYQENWGMAGLSEWFNDEFKTSSSAKIIGERIYFLKDGRMNLRPQKISPERKNQLIKAFLLLTPSERMDRSNYEVYLLDGTRVTIFTEPMAKKDQASLIFRRYLIPNLSFEEQAKRKTIPYESIDFFKSMVQIGFNVVFMGAVRSAKTTFLSTWQSYEDPCLEGVMVETDPEIPMHKILPNAPILQLIADGDDLKNISKSLLRSDADYFILAEARDGIALDTAVKLAAKGTKRMKITFHSRIAEHFPLEAATEIVKSTGGDLHLTMQMVASSFDYLFHLVQLPNKNEKRLKGIYQMSLDENNEIAIDKICSYNFETQSWTFNDLIGPIQREYASETNPEAFSKFEKELKRLSLLKNVQ